MSSAQERSISSANLAGTRCYTLGHMTTANHVLVGTLIAVTVKQPALVLPLAFASHFVLDALPHFGYSGSGYGVAFRHKAFFAMEFFGLTGIALLLATSLYGFNLVLLASIIAVSPDFEWVYRYFLYERKGLKPPKTFLTDFHKKIQWCERSWGMIPEIIFFAILYTVLLKVTS